ncbi:hypothetical protein DYI37_06940 [Fulvimarina endophytica]|uniref:Uncharacterized protein n=1 Tax=Fulvimarina endophytica TaxID=2293836 RepID=A0A371X4E8_9HYPH|nr:hypothetical protein [Fulvimarina endophytica]RFC64093.1 hypothetical protein DYI37_06940 [Fulvimarina endophytica]
MTSYLIDFLLMAALVVTALRTGRMVREIKTLRQSGTELLEALAQSEAALNKAAGAVTALKYDGLDTLRAIEAECERARIAGARLAELVERADFHASGTARPARAPAQAPAQAQAQAPAKALAAGPARGYETAA